MNILHITPLRHATDLQIYGNNTNNSKFNSRKNLKQIKFGECLVIFISESCVTVCSYKITVLPIALYECET
jgi:hypothetical protein